MPARTTSRPRCSHALNVDANQPQGDYVVVDKSEGTLKVYQGDVPDRLGEAGGKLVAQFPVTTGSSHDPLPLGNWKVHDLFLPSAVPLSARPVLGRVGRQGGAASCRRDRTGWSASPGSISPRTITAFTGRPSRRLIGKTESHGCLRMTNWDVMRLSRMMKPGFQAKFVA